MASHVRRFHKRTANRQHYWWIVGFSDGGLFDSLPELNEHKVDRLASAQIDSSD